MESIQQNTSSLSAAQLHNVDALIPVLSRWVGSWRLTLERRPFTDTELAFSYDTAAKHWQKKLTHLGMQSAYSSICHAAQCHSPQVFAQAQTRVLDCGVGSGAFSVALAANLTHSFQIDAVDQSQAMLHQARQQLAQAGIKPALHQADVRSMPFTDNTFDIVIAAHVLEHLADPGQALSEIRRVLKPGGVILLSCTRRSLMGTAIQLKWRTHTVTAPQMTDWLAEHGFRRMKCLHADGHAMFNRLSIAITANTPGPAPWPENSPA